MTTEPQFGQPDDDNPEWTAQDFRRARRGAPWTCQQDTDPRARARSLLRAAEAELERIPEASRHEALGHVRSALKAIPG